MEQAGSKRQKGSHAGQPDYTPAAQDRATAPRPLQQHVQRHAELGRHAPATSGPRVAGKATQRVVKRPALQSPTARGFRPVTAQRQMSRAQRVQHGDSQAGSDHTSASNSKENEPTHSLDDELEYEVESIVDHSPKRTSNAASSKTFTVKWVGYKETTQSHDFDALVNAPQLLQAYCKTKGLHMPWAKKCAAQQAGSTCYRKRLAEGGCEKAQGAQKRQRF